jgi:hypothetical protein
LSSGGAGSSAPTAPAAASAPAATSDAPKEGDAAPSGSGDGESAPPSAPAAPTAEAAPAAPAQPADEKAADGEAKEKEEEEGQKEVAAVPSATDGSAAAPTAPSIDLSMSNVDRLAEKASRKAKRRLRRKLCMENFLASVQGAETAQQLLQAVIVLEAAIPLSMLYKYPRAQLPVRAHTLADVAVRMYALDRAIAYDEIRGMENVAAQCSYKLRFQFYPRCTQSAQCNRFLCHPGKCQMVGESRDATRIPDFSDVRLNSTLVGQYAQLYNQDRVALMQNAYRGQGNAGSQAAMIANQQRRLMYSNQIAQQQRMKDEDQPLEDILRKLLSVRKELDIENIAPFAPNMKDIVESEWV